MSDDGQQQMAEFQAVQERLRLLDGQLAQLEGQALELRRALSTLESLQENQDSLVPIGGGFHVRATLHGDQPVVAPIGSGYAADQSLDAATATLKEQSAAVMATMSKMEEEAQKLANVAQQLAGQIGPRGE